MANIDSQTRSTLAAYFSTHSAAEAAVSQLKEAGFASSHIGYAGRAAENYTSTTGYGTGAGAYDEPLAGSSTGSTIRTATARAGEKTEGAWAKIKNFFEGGDVEPYADEKSRGEFASREITQPNAASDAAGYDGYDSTDLHGSLAGLSIPEEHSRYFGHRLGHGEEGAVVTVNAEGRQAEAEAILTQNGGDLGSDAGSYDYNTPTGTETGSTQRIQLLGEVLRVHKDRISRGEVRLRKEVITEQQTIQVPVSREELVLERVAVDGSTPVTGTIGADSEIRIPLSEETASIDKQTVVREQVAVGKRSVEDVRNLDANVEHEELRVEDSTTGRSKV